MKYYNGDQKNGKTLRDIQNIKINRKLPNIYNIILNIINTNIILIIIIIIIQHIYLV